MVKRTDGWNIKHEEALTDDIISKLVLSNVIKQGGKYWEQCNGGVVDVLRDAFHLLEKREAAYDYGLGYMSSNL